MEAWIISLALLIHLLLWFDWQVVQKGKVLPLFHVIPTFLLPSLHSIREIIQLKTNQNKFIYFNWISSLYELCPYEPVARLKKKGGGGEQSSLNMEKKKREKTKNREKEKEKETRGHKSPP